MTPDPGPISGFPSGWYVAFYGTQRKWFWDRFLRPGFRHVLAFAYAAHAERWLIYDVTHDRTYVRAYTHDAFMGWLDALPPERRIVYFESDDPAPPALRIGFWCAPAVAHLVGVRSRALSPEGLWRDLLASGARVAFEREP